MKPENAVVSIIIPTFYRNKQLRDSIESVFEQTHANKEVIIVDDSGEAHAKDIASEYDVTYIAHNTNRGAQAARNTGLKAATGDFIQLLDDDDRLVDKKIESQLHLFEQNDSVGVVYCGIRVGKTEHEPNSNFRGKVLREVLVFDHYPAQTATMLIRADTLNQIMPLSERAGKDEVGMIIELAQITEFDYINEPLVEKGVQGRHRGETPEAGQEGIHLVQEYADIYADFSYEVKYQALQHQYRRYAHVLLKNELWSGKAILAALKSCYFGVLSGHLSVKSVKIVFISPLGGAGYRVLWPVYKSVSK